MADPTTTVRVRKSTRERPNKTSAEQQASVDEIISAGLAASERERWRRQAELDARRLAADPPDRQELADVIRPLTGG
jgi:hypothetical protein